MLSNWQHRAEFLGGQLPARSAQSNQPVERSAINCAHHPSPYTAAVPTAAG